MNKTVLLTPSIYCGDTANLSDEVRKLQAVGINWIHFDVMDGHFVSNYGLGPKELNDLKNHYPNLTIDVHIMAMNIMNLLPLFIKADYLTFHWNSIKNRGEGENIILAIKQYHFKVGIALDLDNDINEIAPLLASINLVTLMAIKPGFTGQQFEPLVWKKIKTISVWKQQFPHLLFQIDGGVRWNNIQQLITSELDLIVVGSLLFQEQDYQKVIDNINKTKKY
ncbi:ribulose-phosphate 3-epimerase [Spiroplasma melliferum]|uniref:Ribulose-phosphate 3-epimerase n=2 Tax=Spiroplasma melliferum TaxID=2134 RepID=A0AAI9T3X8_SPIME|nr:ribulose-phosphate 3-epimerase [Spiroplasma melliferum]KAI92973.1 ribulose-phosphate 3-epimerase [Spiroplasma melliferum KC3]QCO23853.1 Ribulose-phosphate 3-epimerase [Spiroplasma melliferum]